MAGRAPIPASKVGQFGHKSGGIRLHDATIRLTMQGVARRRLGWRGVVVMGAAGVAYELGVGRREEDSRAPMEALAEIRRATDEALRECRVVALALEGTLPREVYAHYLCNVAYYARYSPVILAAAASRSSISHPELSGYLLRHAAEEEGHEEWALEDLQQLGIPRKQVEQTPPVPACLALVGYVHDLASAQNPIATYGWMYVLEFVGSDLGGSVGRGLSLDEGSGPAPSRFVKGHGNLDASHAAEIEACLAEHLSHDRDKIDICQAARVVSDLYVTMFRQIGGEQPRWVFP